jgi:hypothetical protein
MNSKILLLSLAFGAAQLQSRILAQPPYSSIPQNVADVRIHFFKIKKDIVQAMGGTANDFSFTDMTQLITTLSSFRDAGNKYDGVRLYFALSDNRPQTGFTINTLYIVLVPTMPTTLIDANNNTISDDDEDNAYIISNGAITSVNLNTDRFVRRWINRFTGQVVHRIELTYQSAYGIHIDETHSLWYSARVMFKNSADGLGPDLLTYLRTQVITQADIMFASWVLDPVNDPAGSDFAFKLSLVFKFQEMNVAKPIVVSLNINDIRHNILKSDKDSAQKRKLIDLTLQNTYTDTGNPCPTKKCP